MILAADTTNLPTVIAVLAALAAVGASLVTAFVAVTNIKPTRKKTTAEADRLAAETPFQGGSYIKELSEAASSLVTPLRNENEKLLRRVQELEQRVAALEATRLEALRDLNKERDEISMTKAEFDRKLREINDRHKREVAELRAKIAELEARIASTLRDDK